MKAHLLCLLGIILFPSLIFAQCAGSNESGYLGFFNDGSGADNYQNNQSCSWTFTSDFDTRVRVGFYNFASEIDFDFLRIYDGANASAPLIAEISGTTEINQFYSTGNVIHVTWVTDISYTDTGFEAYWDAYSEELEECYSSIISYPTAGYPDNAVFKWLIMPGGANEIVWYFTQLNMESTFDFVNIYDGMNNSAPLLGAYTGNSLPLNPITATSGAMFIEVTTDVSNSSAGFSGIYLCSTCGGSETLTSSSGIFSDGSENGDYSDDLNCEWLIQPLGAETIELNFLEVDMESCCDWVYVYDGVDANGTLLASVNGQNMPQGLIASSGSAYVLFTSDEDTTGPGWELEYSSSAVGINDIRTDFSAYVYPNPTSGQVQLNLSSTISQRYNIDLYDVQGRSIPMSWDNSRMIYNETVNLDFETVSSGFYLLVLRNEKGFSKQIQIQKL